MNLLALEQGTDLWLETRKSHNCASDAPAMMGVSKYKSRNQLLTEKKTGKREEISPTMQEIFDRGHETEDAARTILEMRMLEDYAPVVCTKEIDGVKLLASLDGLSEDGKIDFEHKLWNATLAENVTNGVLEPHYYWQLEHQLLVSGAEQALFVCSDGTEENWGELSYCSVPERRTELIAGWKQFDADLKTFEPKAKLEVVTAQKAADFPVVTFKVEGSAIVSNIASVLPVFKKRAEREMGRTLETDQDFADKEALNKSTKAAREKLKEIVANVKSEFVSFSEFADTAQQIDGILQKMQAQGEKQVKQAKEAKKVSIRQGAVDSLNQYIYACSDKIKPLTLIRLIELKPDWDGAMKNKRNLESLQGAVDDVLAKTKIEIDAVMARIIPNQIYLREHGKDYLFLFSDINQIINQETEPFQSIVKARIADHEAAEKEKAEALREKIRQEEESKATEKVTAAKEKAAEQNNEKAEKTSVSVPEPGIEGATINAPVFADEPTGSAPLTFAEDLSVWAKEYSVPQRAVNALGELLRKHGV